jgi:hypothetical protein
MTNLRYYSGAVPGARRLTSLPYYDAASGSWELIAKVDDRLVPIKGGRPTLGSYVGVAAEDPTIDLELPLSTFALSSIAYSGVPKAIEGLEWDLHHCAAVLEKYHAISGLRAANEFLAATVAVSELEYLLGVVRSMYDLVQRVTASALPQLLPPASQEEKRGVKRLPESFADVTVKDKNKDILRSAEEIEALYRMPTALARFYASEALVFSRLRKIRDDIHHSRRELPHVNWSSAGLAVSPGRPPWNMTIPWTPAQFDERGLGSLRFVFAWLIHHVLAVTVKFREAFTDSVTLEPPMFTPPHRVFLRHPAGARLTTLPATLAAPWEGPLL